MYCKYANLTKVEIEKCGLPFLAKNKRGFASRFNMVDIFKCIVHKLKSGCQWNNVFEEMFRTYLSIQKDKLDTEKLNLDGTHSLVKKYAESSAYQHRKKSRTSNILIMTDGRGIPIANGGILSGNHNDLYNSVPQYTAMIKQINYCGINVENSIQNADKDFDCKALGRCMARRKIISNIKKICAEEKEKSGAESVVSINVFTKQDSSMKDVSLG